MDILEIKKYCKEEERPNNIDKDGILVCPMCNCSDGILQDSNGIYQCGGCATFIVVDVKKLTIFIDEQIIRLMKLHKLTENIRKKQNNKD